MRQLREYQISRRVKIMQLTLSPEIPLSNEHLEDVFCGKANYSPSTVRSSSHGYSDART